MLHKLMDFPIRPARQSGESLVGFVRRHFGANGHWIPKALHDVIATVYRSHAVQEREDAWSIICRVLGDVPQEYRRLWMEERFTVPDGEYKTYRRQWQNPTTHRYRLCTECLKSADIHLALWDLPLVLACPVHKCMLTKRCDCGRILSWASVGSRWTCLCGRAITSLPTRPAPIGFLYMANAIAAASDMEVPGLEKDEIAMFRVAANLRSTYEVMAWLEGLMKKLPEVRKKSNFKDIGRHWRLTRALKHWPSGLSDLLRRLMKSRHSLDRESLFLHLTEFHPTKQLLDRLNSSAHDTSLPDELQEIAHRVVEDLSFAYGTPRRWIFNPALTNGEKTLKQRSLRHWWLGLSSDIDVSNDPAGLMVLPTVIVSEGDEKTVVQLLNTLIMAAERSISASAFRRLATAWPAQPASTTALSDHKFLELLTCQLLGISRAHREYLLETAQSALGEAHAAK